MSPPIFKGTAVIDLPHDPGTAAQSGGTWRIVDDGASVSMTCPECWTETHKVRVSVIDGGGTYSMVCKCGLAKKCHLVGWNSQLKGGL